MIELVVAFALFVTPRVQSFEATAYTIDDCGRWCDGLTSTMIVPMEGRTVACERSLTKRRARIYLLGIGWRRCEDVGSAIGRNDIDLFVDARSDALAFGRQDRWGFVW